MRDRSAVALFSDFFNLRRHINLWKITRKDGEIFRFTDNNVKIEFNGEVFSPVGGGSPRAMENQDSPEPMSGGFDAIVSDIINKADLRTGLFLDAKVMQYVVDRRYPWAGYIYKNVMFISKTSYNNDIAEIELKGPGYYFVRPIGLYYTRTCRHQLGDAQCQSAVITAGITVTSVISPIKFEAAHGFTINRLSYGYVEWSGGDNAGFLSDIKENGAGDITLQTEPPNPIKIGDTATVAEGCDKNFSTCKDRFSNHVNFGGFPFIPGRDAVVKIV